MGAMAAYLGALASHLLKARRIAASFFATGFALALLGWVLRWGQVGHLPLQNLFEVFLFLGVLVWPMSLLCQRYLKVGGQAIDALLGIVVLFPAAFVFTAAPQQLPPALRSWLFAPHVGTYMAAYIVLAKAGLLAARELFRGRPADADGAARGAQMQAGG
jgi:ABC-type transport system involved in cytochrome c biogenesis permease subunit